MCDQCEERRKPTLKRTFVMVKPDGVERNLVGECITRFERRGLKVLAVKTVFPTEELVRDHYVEHKGQEDFYDLVCEALMKGPMVAVILEGIEAVRSARQIIGSPVESPMGTIRGDFAYAEPYNIIHGADSRSAALREMKIWFGEDDPVVKESLGNYTTEKGFTKEKMNEAAELFMTAAPKLIAFDELLKLKKIPKKDTEVSNA